MEAGPAQERIYEGESGYVTVDLIDARGKQGALFYFANPDPRKLHAVDSPGMKEMYQGVSAIEHRANLEFAIFHGAYDPIHAGADITEFAGDPDYAAIQEHLDRGTALDTRIKALWHRLRTVGIFCGDRYGGSVEWPLFAEWGVCDSATRLQFSEVHLGIVPGWNGILNTMLKAGGLNARYMGATGNPVTASQLKEIGLVQTVVETPPAPNRREVPPEEWEGIWQSHANTCSKLLLDAALAQAAQLDDPIRPDGPTLTTGDDLESELATRMNPVAYAKLRDAIAAEAADLDPETHKDELKALSRKALSELNILGKPLAPQSVAAIDDFIARFGALSRGELLDRLDEIGHFEASQCGDLMHTEHRRIGVGAVLARDPSAKIPVFD